MALSVCCSVIIGFSDFGNMDEKKYKIPWMKAGGNIGRVMLVEFADSDNAVFDEIMEVIKRHPDFQKFEVKREEKISLPGLEIYPDQRKIYRDRQEIHLTAKEYDLLCLLTANKGRVLTYAQIYESVWGDISSGNENTAIGYHICNLREKLYAASPNSPFEIRCVREVGYCFEVNN